jgi:hypothetical protein
MHTSIEKEIRINQPYWRKTNSSLSPEQLQSWLNEQEMARNSLAGMKRPIPVRAVEAYLESLSPGGNKLASKLTGLCSDEIDQAYRTVHLALVSCGVLRIPFQTVVDGKLPADPYLAKADQEVVDLRQMDLGLTKVKAAKDVVEYFRKIANPQGAQVVVYGGSTKAGKLLNEIRAKGANVTLEGAYCNRVATFKNSTEPKKKKRYKTKNPGGTIDPTKWRNYVEAEIGINEPYWAKFREKLSSADAAALSESLQRAEIELIQALHNNGGMFDARQMIDYEAGKEGSGKLVSKARAACETLRIPFQCVAATPVSEHIGYSKTVEDFRQMDLGLEKFAGFGPMAEYFCSEGRKAAVLTAGPESLVAARTRAKNNRIVVEVSGAYGNRLVRLVKTDDSAIQARHKRQQSRRDQEANDGEFIFSNRYHLFAVGKPVYVEGNYATLMREICKKFGPYSCTTSRIANKKGRDVTLNSITKPGETN